MWVIGRCLFVPSGQRGVHGRKRHVHTWYTSLFVSLNLALLHLRLRLRLPGSILTLRWVDAHLVDLASPAPCLLMRWYSTFRLGV